MKKFIALAAVAALAACAQPETATEEEATEEVAETGPIAADGLPTPATYRVTLANGDVIMEEVREDGTYTATMADGSTESGTWSQPSPDVYCTTSDEEGAEEDCNDEMIDENGVWVSKDRESGETATVERVVDEAAE
ncbi:hypothetical protein [Altererythrobacter sp.]|uniref:hypothetical protein n=1 Tax=Altererythrobacter sp. TaxID=1872480 RepID=UPI001AFF1D37|nr:hypothetical protein [Altererythrobacter sp.]MBO6608858.1 hypothetical protein [Altererythrobacter sp.]MBO6640898.1 hypothetical protein [Altererythrobacter sp.]MBO6708404.1 hypothetical protein [Altererythrobacter sp.]MBO6945459.1 hypothetical protein [Altererythrobacter sp.]